MVRSHYALAKVDAAFQECKHEYKKCEHDKDKKGLKFILKAAFSVFLAICTFLAVVALE